MTKKSWMKTTVMAGVMTLGLLCATSAWAVTNIQFPFKVSLTELRGVMTQQFADQVAKATDGRYKVTIYPNGDPYEGEGAVQAVQLGNMQMVQAPDSAYMGLTKVVGLVETPFAFSSQQDFWNFLNGSSGKAMMKQLESKGLAGLAIFDEGPMIIATKDHLLKKPSDYKGEVIRTSGHQLVVDAVRAMGASTVKIGFNEAYSAIQQGTVSGIYTTFDAFIRSKFYEVAPHVTLFPARGAYFWTVNEQWWEAQPKADRKRIKEIARKIGKKYNQKVWNNLADYKKTLKKHGGDYFNPSANKKTLKAFRSAVEPAYDKMRKIYGKQIVDNLLAGKPIKLDN